MDTVAIASLLVLVLLLSMSAYTELKSARIPNWLTLSGVSCGLLFGVLPGGLTMEDSFLGLFVGFGILFIFYVFGGMGGGDVKLMGAVGSLIGYPLIVPALIYTAIIGGVMAIFLVISRSLGNLLRSRRAIPALATGPAAAATPTPAPADAALPAPTLDAPAAAAAAAALPAPAAPAPAPALTVPYALAIAAGTLLVFVFTTS